MNRYTFVIHVHADGPTTLENVRTCECVPLSDLDAVGPKSSAGSRRCPTASDRLTCGSVRLPRRMADRGP